MRHCSIWNSLVLILTLLGFSRDHRCVAMQGPAQENLTAFIPTTEWQPVLPNQPLPPGLRVRVNLQTGQKEARLMGPDDTEDDSQTAVLQSPTKNDQEPLVKDRSSYNKSFMEDLLQQASLFSSTNQSNDSDVKSRFRSYEELKREFEAMNMEIKTDHEILAGIIQELQQNSLNESRLLVLLEDLDYLLHQVDNGKKFSEEGGFSLLAQILQSPHLTVKRAVLKAFSAAIQGNTVAKVIALQNGTLDTLFDLLSEVRELKASAEDLLKVVQSGLGMLGALLRDFPAAQRYFFGNHSAMDASTTSDKSWSRPSGFILLASLFDFTRLVDQPNLSSSVRMRILTFLTDLARERVSAKERAQTPNDSIGLKLWQLYSTVPFESGFVESGWCMRLQYVFHTDVKSAREARGNVNHGHLQDLLTSLLYLDPVCNDAILKLLGDSDPRGLRDDLLRLHEEYSAAAARSSSRASASEDDEDSLDYFAQDMQNLIERLLDLNGTRRAARPLHRHHADEL